MQCQKGTWSIASECAVLIMRWVCNNVVCVYDHPLLSNVFTTCKFVVWFRKHDMAAVHLGKNSG